jgi:hypothetical protein
MMDEEDVTEAKEEDDEEDVTEAKEEDDEEDVTEGMHDDEEDVTEGMMDEMGGDAADDLIDDVEMEEEGITIEGDDAMGDDDMGGEDLEDRVVRLEDEVDRLVAEFEDIMDGNFDGDDMDIHGGDELEMDDTAEFGDDEGAEEFGGEEEMGMMEAVSLKAAPKPTTSEEGGINKKSTVAANSGARGMEGKPVHTGTSMGGKHDTPAYSNSTKDLISDFQNKAGSGMKDMKAAPKPVTSQASGVNNKSPLKGR